MPTITMEQDGPRQRKMLKERAGKFTIPFSMIGVSYGLALFYDSSQELKCSDKYPYDKRTDTHTFMGHIEDSNHAEPGVQNKVSL
jgi:hypothetical protein